VFVGQRHQRGHGLAQTISELLKRFVIPFAAPRAKEVGTKVQGNVAETCMEMVGDVVSGRSAKESLKERGLAGKKRTITDIARQSPTEDTRVNIAAPKARKKKKRRKVVVKPKSKDIFD